ncbi:MAG: hypothetical protein ACPKOI_04525 [Pleomorphochaeta sp.]
MTQKILNSLGKTIYKGREIYLKAGNVVLMSKKLISPLRVEPSS